MAPYGTPWNYSAEHIRIPAAPEPVSYTTQPGYPSDEQGKYCLLLFIMEDLVTTLIYSKLCLVDGQRIAQPRIWNVVKDEPEDLTGRHRENKAHQDSLQRNSDAQTTTGESGSDSDSDLCIDEQVKRFKNKERL